MASRLLSRSSWPSWRGGGGGGGATTRAALGIPLALATAVGSIVLLQSTNTTATLDDATRDSSTSSDASLSYQININFMDKLASKAYLHFLGHEESSSSSSSNQNYHDRPVGVPDTLRILTVDLPEVRRGFKGGTCAVDASRIYPDGIASPEIIETTKPGRGGRHHQHSNSNHNHHGKKINVPVEQKAWVKSMVKCIAEGHAGNHVSVEIMEADVGRMNPANIRRIHQYGTLRYDPGKYAVTSPRTDRKPARSSPRSDRNSLKDDDEEKLLNELQAPWHQQSWREEAMLRISGQVGFGETMVESDKWTKWIFGYEFQSTVNPNKSSLLWDSIFFWRSRQAQEGIDGSSIPNQASNRPHCVIANGMALQMVPNSLRVLQKLCAEYDVPLFVIRDPRSWGGNTHPDDLGEVLRDVQKTVKSRIVTGSLRHSAGTAFTRGRFVGRLETDAAWQAKEAARRSKEITRQLTEAFRKQNESDWSKLDETDLEKRLEMHGLVRTIEGSGSDTDDKDNNTETSKKKELNEALRKIASRYGLNQTAATDQSEQSNTGD